VTTPVQGPRDHCMYQGASSISRYGEYDRTGAHQVHHVASGFSSGTWSAAFFCGCLRSRSLCQLMHVAGVLLPSSPLPQGPWGTGLALGEPVVPRRFWNLSVKFSKFLQAAYRKVVEWLLCPVLTFRIVELFNEVEDSFVVSPAALDRRHDFFHIVFLALLDVICFPEYL